MRRAVFVLCAVTAACAVVQLIWFREATAGEIAADSLDAVPGRRRRLGRA
mgnify:CR=1 FL=1